MTKVPDGWSTVRVNDSTRIEEIGNESTRIEEIYDDRQRYLGEEAAFGEVPRGRLQKSYANSRVIENEEHTDRRSTKYR